MAEKTTSSKSAWDKQKTRELFRRYKEQGDMDAREQLVMSHMNLVRFLANKFKNRGEPLDDLMQVGYLGLLKAIDRYAEEDSELALTDDRLIIEEALAGFSPREREVVELRFLKGMTQIEIAEQLGISQVQVSRLLRRTLKKIQDRLDPEGLMQGR